MKKQLEYTLRLFLHYYLLLLMGKLIFFISQYSLFQENNSSFHDLFLILKNGFHLDLSTFAYLYIPVFLLLIGSALRQSKWWNKILSGYIIFITFIISLIFIGEAGIYGDWNSKLSYKALLYLKNPSEMLQALSWIDIMTALLLIAIQNISFYFIYQKWVKIPFLSQAKKWAVILYFLLVPPLWLVTARGGFTGLPISQSDSYFSNKQILNDIAVNPIWNITHSIAYGYNSFETNPYHFMDDEKAQEIYKQLFHSSADSFPDLLTTNRPNIVLIMLESWSADAIQSIEPHELNFTPEFGELEKNGLFFTEVYSSGMRTQQGFASILSGYPSLPETFITNFPEKSKQLPAISSSLKKEGYQNSFFYGGELIFGNLKAFLYDHHFDKITDQNDIKGNFQKLKLGYHDEVMLPYWIENLKEEKEPFFSSLLTVSSHRPYEQPKPDHFKEEILRINYLNAIYYADSCLGDFMERAKKESWYANTLFIFVADHGHPSHIRQPYLNFNVAHIPLLLYGEVIRTEYRGKRMNQLMNQHDLAALLLSQLHISHQEFKWSKNPLAQNYHPFAFQDMYNGFGFKTPSGTVHFYNNQLQKHTFSSPEDSVNLEDALLKGKGYLQLLFQEVIEL